MTSSKAPYQPSRLLICGDLDVPVADDCSISPGLDDVLETLGLEQHVRSPIRNDPDHLLDLIITDQPSNIRDVRVIDSGLVSDHRLILASVDITSSSVITVLLTSQGRGFIHRSYQLLQKYVCDTQIDPHINRYHVFIMW